MIGKGNYEYAVPFYGVIINDRQYTDRPFVRESDMKSMDHTSFGLEATLM